MSNYMIASLVIIGLLLIPVVGHAQPDESLLIYLPLDDGSGKVAKDVTGFQNDGNLMSNPKWTTGKFGGGLELNGTSSYVDIPWDDSLDVKDGDFSAEIWFKYEEKANAGSLIWAYNVGADVPQFWVRTHPGDNNITALFWDGKAPDGPVVETPEAYNDNQWHYLAFVRTGDKLDIYIDAKLAGSERGKEGSVTAGHAYGIHLGQRVDGDNKYKGDLDEFRFWKRPLSLNEIKKNMKMGKDAFLAVNPAHSLATTWGGIKLSR